MGSCKPKRVSKPGEGTPRKELPECNVNNLLEGIGNLKITEVESSQLKAKSANIERIDLNNKHQGFHLTVETSDNVDFVRYRICTKQVEEVCYPKNPKDYRETYAFDEFLAIPPEIKGPIKIQLQTCTEHSANGTSCSNELIFEPNTVIVPVADPSNMAEFSRQNAMNDRLLQIGSEIVQASETFLKDSTAKNSKIHILAKNLIELGRVNLVVMIQVYFKDLLTELKSPGLSLTEKGNEIPCKSTDEQTANLPTQQFAQNDSSPDSETTKTQASESDQGEGNQLSTAPSTEQGLSNRSTGSDSSTAASNSSADDYNNTVHIPKPREQSTPQEQATSDGFDSGGFILFMFGAMAFTVGGFNGYLNNRHLFSSYRHKTIIRNNLAILNSLDRDGFSNSKRVLALIDEIAESHAILLSPDLRDSGVRVTPGLRGKDYSPEKLRELVNTRDLKGFDDFKKRTAILNGRANGIPNIESLEFKATLPKLQWGSPVKWGILGSILVGVAFSLTSTTDTALQVYIERIQAIEAELENLLESLNQSLSITET